MISPNLDFKTEEAFYEEACQTLPRMTAFFVGELNTPRLPPTGKKGYGTFPRALSGSNPGRKSHTTFEVDLPNGVGGMRELPSRNFFPADRNEHRQKVIQALINGISNHFNDLIMGIWGNASLIRLNLDQGQPAHDRVVQLEKMIQEGAYLIQLILGYLGERRSVGKAIRLHHLVHQIACYLPDKQDTEVLSGKLHWSTITQQPRLMAGATAHIIRMLLGGIETFRRNIVLDTLDIPVVQQRIGIIAALVKKGEMITSQLMCYAGEMPLKTKRANLKAILNRQYYRACQRYGNITIHKTITPHLPAAVIDQKNIEWVVAQLIENAAKILPEAGHLALSLKPFYAEAPGDRCGVHSSRDYLVLSVEDNGPGMSADQQLRIFDPFYTQSQLPSTLGLGLAAANGIIRKHNGYIQVRSKPGQGSCFKIYLPFSG